MEIRIQINCDTIQELEAHLHMLQVQIQDKAKELNLDPKGDDYYTDLIGGKITHWQPLATFKINK